MTGAVPQLSVVVPSLGGADGAEAVGSLLDSARQARVRVQVILVWQAREAPPPAGPAVQVVRAFPAGVSYARNRGIAAATSDVVAFVDEDERVVPGWVAAVLAGFALGADAVAGPIAPADDIGLPHCVLEGDVPRWRSAPDGRPWEAGSGGNLAVRARVLADLGGFDTRMGAGTFGRSAEDTEIIQRLLLRGCRLRWEPGMVALHPTKTAAERLALQEPYGFGAGRMVRRLRAPGVAAHYGLDLGRELVRAAARRDRRRARELAVSGRGFLAGMATPDRWVSPARLLDRLPADVVAAIGARRLVPWRVPHRGDPHFLWAAGDDLVLHAYAGVRDVFRAGARARARALDAGVGGIPEVVAIAADHDVCWVLERRMPGRRARDWWARAADWATGLARTGGPALRTTAWWRAAARLGGVEDALERLGDLPSVVVHGDLQGKNVLVGAGGAPAILDWEDALEAGPPGLDLLYLAVAPHAGSRRVDAVRALAGGRDPAGMEVLARLRRAGVAPERVRDALRVAVAVWIDGERTRRAVLGIPPQPPEFAALAAVEGSAEISAYSAS